MKGGFCERRGGGGRSALSAPETSASGGIAIGMGRGRSKLGKVCTGFGLRRGRRRECREGMSGVGEGHCEEVNKWGLKGRED